MVLRQNKVGDAVLGSWVVQFDCGEWMIHTNEISSGDFEVISASR